MFAILGCGGSDQRPAQAAATAASAQHEDTRGNILFLGTSLTAGYGVGADNAFPALIQQKLDSARLPFSVINAGLSGETSAGGLRRIDWSLQQPISILVLELGANDGLRGLSVDQMRANLDSIMSTTRAKYPDAAIVLAGMQAPPNLGAGYTSAFRKTFSDLAEEYDAVLIPFLLEGVAGEHSLNQEDGIHPNVEGHKRIAALVWRYLQLVISASLAAAARE